MKLTTILGFSAAATLALMAFAGTASATTLEKGGVTQSGSIAIEATLKSGTSALLTDTFGFFGNTCTNSTVAGSTSTKTGPAVEGPISTLSWGSAATPCKEGNPTVHSKGGLAVERIGTTTNGTVESWLAEVTVPSALGLLTCTTSVFGTDLGTLTGVKAGNATMDVNAVLACGIDMKWTATYTVTGPVGLGVTG
jgi:hypothetical protein